MCRLFIVTFLYLHLSSQHIWHQNASGVKHTAVWDGQWFSLSFKCFYCCKLNLGLTGTPGLWATLTFPWPIILSKYTREHTFSSLKTNAYIIIMKCKWSMRTGSCFIYLLTIGKIIGWSCGTCTQWSGLWVWGTSMYGVVPKLNCGSCWSREVLTQPILRWAWSSWP